MTHPVPHTAMNFDWAGARGRRTRVGAFALMLAVMSPGLAYAQQPAPSSAPRRTLSLDEAIRLAAQESEQLQIARAGISRAGGQLRQARSQYLPQINGSVIYARTLKSQFEVFATGADTTTSTTPKAQSLCAPAIPANATPAERAAALAQATTCPAAQGIDFSKVGFGARNAYTFGFTGSQNVYTGGRIKGQTISADAQQRSAEIELVAERAQLALDVTGAYFDAVLADRLVDIADTALAQTEELLRQTKVARQVGNQSEFELLRATVTRDNQRPILITRRGDRDVAYFRLKQLLNLPLDEPLRLSTPMNEPALVTRVIAENSGTTSVSPENAMANSDNRAPVRQSEEAVRAQEGQLKVAKADRLPSLVITSAYQRLFFPAQLLLSINQFSQNWTIGGTLNVPIFNGGRVAGEVEVAQANLEEARARLQQSKELSALDTKVAINQLQAAEAAFEASRGTAQQAERAYSIDQLRYKEGISTQTDLTQSRLLLEQASANQAQTARDLAVARARVALLRDLPINTNGLSAQRAAATVQQAPQLQQRSQSSVAGTPGTAQIGSTTP